MWLGVIVVLAVVLALIGGVIVGGIFAFILIPIAAILVGGAVVASVWARATSGRPSPEDERSQAAPAYPHGGSPNGSAAPATPDQLVDARQKSQ